MTDTTNESVMVFTEVCTDGFYRPVTIVPQKVTNIKRLADARHQNNEMKEYKAYSSIEYDNQEVLLYDSFENVIAAMDATIKYRMYLDIGTRHIKRACEMGNIRYQTDASPA
jgi:hypothetical protein